MKKQKQNKNKKYEDNVIENLALKNLPIFFQILMNHNLKVTLTIFHCENIH